MSAQKLERFTAGEAFAVDPDAIERELASLWRTAGRGTDGLAPVTRACLLNVVALLEEREGREGYGRAETLQYWIDELPRHLAARALVLRNRPKSDQPSELQSWISANCIIAEGGGKLVCSEEVTIAAHGGADRHVPGLVRALLAPGLPTSVLVGGILHGALTEPVLALVDRVVTDVDASAHQAPLATLAQMYQGDRHAGMDLGWVGTAALRAELARAFDPPFEASLLRQVRLLECVSPPECMWSSRLLLGWLSHALGGRAPSRTGDGEWTLERTEGVPLGLKLSVDGSAAGPSFAFHGDAWASPLRVQSLDGHIEVDCPHLPSARRPRQELTGPAAVARALINRSEDRAFRSALDLAGEL